MTIFKLHRSYSSTPSFSTIILNSWSLPQKDLKTAVYASYAQKTSRKKDFFQMCDPFFCISGQCSALLLLLFYQAWEKLCVNNHDIDFIIYMPYFELLSVFWVYWKFYYIWCTYRFNQNKPSGPGYSILMYWTNSWQPTAHVKQCYFWKHSIKTL